MHENTTHSQKTDLIRKNISLAGPGEILAASIRFNPLHLRQSIPIDSIGRIHRMFIASAVSGPPDGKRLKTIMTGFDGSNARGAPSARRAGGSLGFT